MSARIGVLALQGDTREHLAALGAAGAEPLTVRRRAELDSVDALVIPGGESTTMSHLLREFDLLEPLRARLADGMPAYGSCAGMILLAYLPPIWRRVMDRRVVEHYNGDLTRANLHPPKRAALLARYSQTA